jgi:hypothetical protein
MSMAEMPAAKPSARMAPVDVPASMSAMMPMGFPVRDSMAAVTMAGR